MNLKTLFIASALLLGSCAVASSTRHPAKDTSLLRPSALVVTLGSHHENPLRERTAPGLNRTTRRATEDFNEVNPGLGLEWQRGLGPFELRPQAGLVLNSFSELAAYAGTGLGYDTGYAFAGLYAGGYLDVTGRASALFGPVLTLFDHLTIGWVPDYGQGSGEVFWFQWRLPIGN